ncbi:MAG: lysophospholipid acyltransferase family protein [bacterium]
MRLSSRVGSLLGDAGIALGPWLVLALGSTWRLRWVGGPPVPVARRGGGPVMYAHTHGVLLALSYTHRRCGIQVMVSESRDGEIITRIIERLGFGTVRGSTTRGGERALVRLAALGREGRDLGITPDGPKGPRGSAQPGAILIAARAGIPIVPLGVAASRAWRARSWDRFLVPKPFAEVWVVSGPPLRFTREDLGAIDVACATLARALADVEAEAEERAARRKGAEPAPKGAS